MNISKILIGKNKLLLILSILVISNNTIFSTSWAKPVRAEIEIYAEQEFIIDFDKFKIGDNIPNRYQLPEYTIKQWHLRNLPEPDTGRHWVYVNGNYILIDNIDGKIYKVYNRDIFYHQ